MIIEDSYDLGSPQCGKDRAFTCIPTNLTILFKIYSIKTHLLNRGRNRIALKIFDIKGFGSFS